VGVCSTKVITSRWTISLTIEGEQPQITTIAGRVVKTAPANLRWVLAAHLTGEISTG